MSTNSSNTGYEPGLHMPLISIPPEGVTPADHYAAFNVATTINASFNQDNSISFTVSDAGFDSIYAMTGGRVRFYPAGELLPDGSTPNPASGNGTVVLEPWTSDVSLLAQPSPDGVLPGSEPPKFILYGNVAPTEFENAMASQLSEMSVSALRTSWSGGGEAPYTRTDLESNFQSRLMNKDAFVFVNPGTVLGKAAPSTGGGSDALLNLGFASSVGQGFSPQLQMVSLPAMAGPIWQGHPILTAMAGNPIPTSIHVKFEVYDTDLNDFFPTFEGTEVRLVNDALPSGSAELSMLPVNSDGYVNFVHADLASLNPSGSTDLFFEVNTSGQIWGGIQLPASWNSKGWDSTDGTNGLISGFLGGTVGTSTNPLVFRIGIDFHLKIEYILPHFVPIPVQVPEGLQIVFTGESSAGIPWVSPLSLRTDHANGAVHGVYFEAEPGDSAWVEVHFNIGEDPLITMGLVLMFGPNPLPTERVLDTKNSTISNKIWPNINTSSIGSFANPGVVTCADPGNALYIYYLNQARGWHEFWYRIGAGFLTPFSLVVHDGATNATSESNFTATTPSGPVAHIEIHSAKFFDSETFAHEMGHIVEKSEVNYSRTSTGPGGYCPTHYHLMKSNPHHALIEAWPGFLQQFFKSGVSGPRLHFPLSVGTVWEMAVLPPIPATSHTNILLEDLAPGEGSLVEGAMANALWLFFCDHIVTPGVDPNPTVRIDNKGKVSPTDSAWVFDSGVATRFQNLIWNPFKSLSSEAYATTDLLVDRIRTATGNDWYKMRACFNLMNIAIEILGISALSETSGGINENKSITVTGLGFLESKVFDGQEVKIIAEFGPNQATITTVNSQFELEVTVPTASVTGWVDVVLRLEVRGKIFNTATTTLNNAYQYI